MMKNWIQPPRLRIGEENEVEPRRATWLELFYDLVFVVAVSQLANNLSKDVSIWGFLQFALLFIPVWWVWIGTTFYANRFDSDDLGQRLLFAVQMLAVAALAVNVHEGLGENSAGFALAYAVARGILVLEYLWAGKHISQARKLTNRYAIGFAIAAFLWLVSVFVPIPFRFLFWTIGLIVDFATPLTATNLQVQLPPHTEHLPERFGLFTIIVLGEAIIGVVNGVAEMQWNSMSSLAAACGFAIAFSLWWVYFENVGGSVLQDVKSANRIWTAQIWLYVHLPLVIALAATGVGVEHAVASEINLALPGSDRWLLCGSVALCFLALSILHRTGTIKHCTKRSNQRLVAVAALIALAIAGRNLLPVAVITLVAIVCLSEVFLDLYQSRRIGTSLS